ncbi:reprolysin-like metallopeptidase, partial [Chryseobacterium sp. 2TAF14]|uniref:reprolysin-like metallopeptidase n=1 Tax=Chryseobacterium sp. 2TAF14 TaxID=3233007 RepID=UPI003F9022CA
MICRQKKKSEQKSVTPSVGSQIRIYRLAVACTGEYAVAATGYASPTVAQTLSAIVTTVNRVNGVYEQDLAVRLVLVANETSVIFTDPSTDPFTGNDDAYTLIDESQTNINSIIGAANYDVGHTFSTGGGGLAGLGVICTNSQKASGITGSSNPIGDPYDIDYVAHELGHQFGGPHTFNATTGSCNGN